MINVRSSKNWVWEPFKRDTAFDEGDLGFIPTQFYMLSVSCGGEVKISSTVCNGRAVLFQLFIEVSKLPLVFCQNFRLSIAKTFTKEPLTESADMIATQSHIFRVNDVSI